VRFEETSLPGAFVVELDLNRDFRGYFARTWCTREFADAGLPTAFVQASISHNERRGTLRGMHMQLPPSREGKLVRCTRGRIYDVIVDLRPDSHAYLHHFGIELTADAQKALYIPPMMLHGFETLDDGTDVFYQMTDSYSPGLGFGARWNDPAFGIRWPIETGLVMIERDTTYADFDRHTYEQRVMPAIESRA